MVTWPGTVMASTCVIVACMAGACMHQESRVWPPPIPASATTRPTMSDAELADAVCARTRSQWHAGWGVGDMQMVLFPGGRYVVQTYGCQGLYGASTGSWSVHDGVIRLAQDDTFGQAEPIRTLRACVAGTTSELVLVPGSREQEFQRSGVDRETCFRDRVWWEPTTRSATAP